MFQKAQTSLYKFLFSNCASNRSLWKLISFHLYSQSKHVFNTRVDRVQGSRIPISRHQWIVNFEDGKVHIQGLIVRGKVKKIALNKTGDHRGMLSILPSVIQFRIYRVFLIVCFRFGVVSLHSDDIHCYTITHYRSEWMKVVLNFGNVDGMCKNGFGN